MRLLEISGLEKSYAGKKALCGVDMTLDSGEIVGLLGPNASGKTTMLKAVAGLLSPDAGTINYPGGATGTEARKTVSLMPDAMALPSWMKVRDAFGYFEDMYPDFSLKRATAMRELLELPSDTAVKKLSKGMKERVSLGLAFSRETQVYLLDEPLGGIDPMGKTRILDSILAMRLDESVILLSTHLVKDVETIFDSVYFLSAGRVIYQNGCEAIREQSGKTVEQAYLEVFANVETD